MAPKSLADFLDRLDEAGQLARVQADVSADGEIAEISRRVVADDGRAILFQSVKDVEHAVLTNRYGSERRFCLALGADSIEEVAGRLCDRSEGGGSWLDRIKSPFQTSSDTVNAPRTVKTASCHQVVKLGRDVDLSELPAVRWGDAETAHPLPDVTIVSSDWEGNERCVGTYDVQVLDRDQLAITWSPHDAIARHFRSFAKAGEKMPLAIVIGGPPSVAVAAHAKLPRHVDAFAFAGLLGASPVDLTTCRSLALQVPAEAEMILESHIATDVSEFATSPSPRANGFCVGSTHARKIEVGVVTHRASLLWPATIYHRPPNETTQIARLLDRCFLPRWQQTIDELVDLARPASAATDHFVFASIRKTHPWQAGKVANALWGLDAVMTTNVLVVVDDDVDVHNEADVWYHVGAHAHLARDLMFQEGPSGNFEYRNPHDAPSRKMAIDATAKMPEETAGAAGSPAAITSSNLVREEITRRWNEFELPKKDPRIREP